MKEAFHLRRRQQFLTEPYFQATLSELDSVRDELLACTKKPEASPNQLRGWNYFLAEDAYKRFSIRYTSGASCELLRSELTSVVAAYECYQRALAAFEQAPMMSPLGLDQLGDYERAVQILGLCVLLHRPDLLERMAALIDPGYKGEDTLYEDLLAFYQAGRIELDEWYHDEPYSPLVKVIYEHDSVTASALLNEYVEGWYPAFKHVPWHDGHLRINGTDGDYFGYWAFEAGAVAYLCNVDDSAVTHMVYPKDLVAWARAHADLSGTTSDERKNSRLRCEGGQPCPLDGWWDTPAKADSRRQFKQGEVMPVLESSYGMTIWQWVDAT